MLVPTKCPPYDENLTRSIQLDTTYLGLALDPEGATTAITTRSSRDARHSRP